MALKIKAFNLIRPRLKMGKPVREREIANYIADRTSLNRGEIINVINELHDTVVHFCLQGRTVILNRLGRYSPTLKITGEIKAKHVADNDLKKAVNNLDLYEGTIVNRENIVENSDELVAIWNDLHPEDPITD
jgi:nucleoid DNA-binding protein